MADAALEHLRERPTVMKSYVRGIEEEPIWQKRVPQKIPDWLQTATVYVPVGPHGRGAQRQTTPRTSCGRNTSASST